MAEVIVSFKDWTGPTKNPAAADKLEVMVERKISRVIVSSGSKELPRGIEKLSEIIQINSAIGQKLIGQILLNSKSSLGYEQMVAGYKAALRSTDMSSRILERAKEILAEARS